jgi:regulatory protein
MDAPRAKSLKRTAQKKMMDYLALRDHTEKELREKLNSLYSLEEIDQAILVAKQNRWIAASAESEHKVSVETAKALGKKGRGIGFINQYLEKKGLPEIVLDSASELEKAKSLVENKYSDLSKMDQRQRAKAGRFLLSRGFEMDVVQQIIGDVFEEVEDEKF